jgi:hypothetical protein
MGQPALTPPELVYLRIANPRVRDGNLERDMGENESQRALFYYFNFWGDCNTSAKTCS